MKQENWDPYRFLFWVILSFAAVVRLKGLGAGLPLHTLYGENDTFSVLMQMLKARSLNPGTYFYPGLAYYIYLPFLYLFYLIGFGLGYFNGLSSVPESSFILIGRLVSALLGTLSVYAVYRIGKYFSPWIALLAMAILAAVPQHIEFSHMLRPEVPGVCFMLLAHWSALRILETGEARAYGLFGVFAGAAISIMALIGVPALLTLLAVCWMRRKSDSWILPLRAVLGLVLVFLATNPFLAVNPGALLAWVEKVDTFRLPSESYYAKNIVHYYIEFLTRYNFSLPLICFASAGLMISYFRDKRRALLLSLYPLFVFLWLCLYERRRVQGLIPLHPFLSLWAAIALEQLWLVTRRVSRAPLFKIAYALLLAAVLFFPYYRSSIQTYLLSKMDNRSKAELWMINRLPKGSRVALLQFQQIELDRDYFQVQDFVPSEYLDQKDFRWFESRGFDYVVVSSGQYMRYFVEGKQAEPYKKYFSRLFEDGERYGTLVLDLVTHPVLIPDYRIKIYSTHKASIRPAFLQAIGNGGVDEKAELVKSPVILNLAPGYYLLELPDERGGSYRVEAKNLKLNEAILSKDATQALSAGEQGSQFPFAILANKANPKIVLFGKAHTEITPEQPVQFKWRGDLKGLRVRRIQPSIEILNTEFLPVQAQDASKPFLLFPQKQRFIVKMSILNHSKQSVAGYLEAFLSHIGEPQPWKDYERASDTQEFFLESNQAISIEIPFNTSKLTGDHELSAWVFTRQDLPFSPQNGVLFNKEIRVQSPRLGIHPIYEIPIP